MGMKEPEPSVSGDPGYLKHHHRPDPGRYLRRQSGLGGAGEWLMSEHTPLYLSRRGVFRFKMFDQIIARIPRIDGVTAGENVNRSVANFRPRVNRQMGLGNDDDTADTLGAKLVKCDFSHFSTGFKSGLHHNFLYCLSVIDKFRVATKSFT